MIQNKRQYFEQSTRYLLNQLDKMQLDKMSRIRAKNFTRAIRDAMTKPYVQTQTFNLFPHECAFGYDSLGFCRVSSLTFINLMSEHGVLNKDWQLYVINTKSMMHHFLKYTPDNIIFDLTFDQFSVNNISIPYNISKRTFIGTFNEHDPVYDFYNAGGFNDFKPLDLPSATLKDR